MAVAVIHYGSRAHGSTPHPDSAHDFFLVVDRYGPVYRQLRRALGTPASPRLAAVLAHWLPPNVISIPLGMDGNGAKRDAKCVIYSTSHFRQALSSRAHDHYAQGRLFQHVEFGWTRDAGARRAILDDLIDCRLQTLRWARAHLPSSFDVDEYLRTLLELSFAGEVRPELPSRVHELLDAQLPQLREPYRAVLAALSADGLLVATESGYGLAKPLAESARRHNGRYFRRSKRRLMLRLAKHVVLFDGWLPYLARKIERRTGLQVDLSERERRWPLIFLWPRAIEFVRRHPHKRGG
jgi:hypothetical protein